MADNDIMELSDSDEKVVNRSLDFNNLGTSNDEDDGADSILKRAVLAEKKRKLKKIAEAQREFKKFMAEQAEEKEAARKKALKKEKMKLEPRGGPLQGTLQRRCPLGGQEGGARER